MKKLKLSQWHDGSVKPVHVGVYEVKECGGIWYSYFDGSNFMYRSCSASDAYNRATCPSLYGAIPINWRGVLK